MKSMHSTQLIAARKRFFEDGGTAKGMVSDTILRSWQRCAGLGFSERSEPHVAPMTRQALHEACQAHEELRNLCRPELQSLYADARATGSIVILSASNGLILDALGSADFLGKAARVALTPGVPWSETATGTNAIGTAIIEGRAVEVRGSEHFFAPHRVLSCSAVPIVNPEGIVAGVLDLSGEASIHHLHALGMVRLAVDHIERRMFDRDFPGCVKLRLQRDASLLGTVEEGILVFDGDKLRAANRYGLAMLELSRGDIGRRTFDDIFDGHIGDALTRQSIRDHRGSIFRTQRDVAPARSAPRVSKNPTRETFYVNPFFDAFQQRELARARRILEAGLPILLQGETGTGKEMFARELARSYASKDAAFVAVNCAGLPESLIESELFGYEEGAFTGARRHGSKGLLQAADGGVLFLDEIGDMPLALQARLLRALQEREVTPLGSSKSVKVNFALISATHCDLESAVARGCFRSDLYFRISQYAIRLPCVREAANRRALIENLWRDGARGLEMDDDVLQRMAAYSWPGNLRQLVDTLRALFALTDRGSRASVEDLPSFLRAYGCEKSAQATQEDVSTLSGITDRALRHTLQSLDGNVAAAARHLGISRSTFYRRLKQNA
jgi:sigma-54 dependent transcriptional regulator, acetoin dehydrogenase operon transcriptional activator AcoR